MKSRINPQPIPQRAIRSQRLAQHRPQKNRQRIVVPQSWHINRNLQPLAAALALTRRINVLALTLSFPNGIRPPSPLNLRLNAHDSFRAVGEADARGAVGGRQDVCFGDEGAELRRRAAVGADGGCRGEGGLQVGELGGREGDVGVGCHCSFRELVAPGARRALSRRFLARVGWVLRFYWR